MEVNASTGTHGPPIAPGHPSLDAVTEGRSLVDVANAGVHVRNRDELGPRAVVCTVGPFKGALRGQSQQQAGRRSNPADVDARPRTVALHVPVNRGMRRSAQPEKVVPSTCPIGLPLDGQRRTTAYRDKKE